MLLNALSATEGSEDYRYKISDHKFSVFQKEPTDDGDFYEIHYMQLPNMKKTQLTQGIAEIIEKQMEDVAALCKKYETQKSLLRICETDIDKLNEQYFTLTKEKEDYERKVLAKCLALLNEKKKFIRDGMMETTRGQDSSIDINEFILNDGLRFSPKKEPEEIIEAKSPIASSSNFTAKNVTPKSTLTSQKTKRTPSKKLFAQISQPSDSDDDSFDILPVNDENPRKRKNLDTPDTSSIFKNFKVKTPKKPKREEKESSVEAKKDCSEKFRPQNMSSPSEIDSKSSMENAQRIVGKEFSNPLDVFKSEDILSQSIDDFNIQEELSPPKSSESLTERRNLRSRKNPYSVDTMNILDN